MLYSHQKMLEIAQLNKFAIGAFNCNNLEIVQGIIETAQEENSPVIVQASQGAIRYAGLEEIKALVYTIGSKAIVPVSLHLDHGKDLEQVKACIKIGFSSVMYDGSDLPLEINIKNTREIVLYSYPFMIPVEGELGRIAGKEDSISVVRAKMTNPLEAKQFVLATKVSSLAIAVGSKHGMEEQSISLDIPRIVKIRKITKIPLVLHGASGVKNSSIREAIEAGIAKINIDTHLRKAFTIGVKSYLNSAPDDIDPRHYLGAGKEELKEAVREKIQLFRSNKKGDLFK